MSDHQRPTSRQPAGLRPLRGAGFFLALLLSWILAAAPVLAHGIIIPEPPAPPLPPERPGPATLSLERLQVDATVEGSIATVRVEQRFVNRGSTNAEGTYLFPLPQGATIRSFKMYIDNEPLGGELLSAEEARRIYEGIVARNRDPALLQYVGSGLISAQVFPVPPGEERTIALEYTQVVPQEGRLKELVLPAGGAPEVVVQLRLESRSPLTSLYSPTHTVAIHRDGPRRATVSYEGNGSQGPQELRLYFGGESGGSGELSADLLTYALPGEPGYFLLLVSPPLAVPAGEVQAKDVILVLDTSGSMEGQKLIQARDALQFVLERLGAADRFGLIAFHSEVRLYRQELLPAAEAAAAVGWVQQLGAGGSTNISGALEKAQQLAAAEQQPGRPQYIIFLTDGLPTIGLREPGQILGLVREGAAPNQRIFTFGVGYDVNTLLLDGLARENRGISTYVQPGEDLEEKVSSFYRKVASPVLSDLTVAVDGVQVEDLYPRPLGDLFAGSQLVVAGRYPGSGPATLTLRGTLNGKVREYRFDDLTFPAQSTGRDFVPRLWAGRKIAYLLQEIRLHGESREVVDEVVALSQRYGILTPYTAFLIQEPDLMTSTDAAGEAVRAAATSAPQSGAGAVEAAKSVGDLYLADSLQDQQAAQAPAMVAPSGATASGGSAAGTGAAPADGRGGGGQAQSGAGPGAGSPVRTAGDKTFLFRNGIWTDTAYTPGASLQELPFGTPEYFALAARYGRYLSVGLPLIVVLEGQAYRVTAEESPAPPGGNTSPSADPSAGPSADPEVAPPPVGGSTRSVPPSAAVLLVAAAGAWGLARLRQHRPR